MNTRKYLNHFLQLGTRLFLAATLAATSFALTIPFGELLPVQAAVQTMPSAGSKTVESAPQPANVLPASGCTFSAGAYACALYATTGTLALPNGASVPIYGYSGTNTVGSAALPGPALIVTAGFPVAITLTNVNLPSATSLSISEQGGIPDTTGVTAGLSKTYTFSASALQPGTYLYEAGLTPDGPRQAAMGLFGALVVRPSGCANCAYGPTTTFDDEALLILSEVDPALNAAPSTFRMSDYAPKYWLINGKAYPNTDAITSLPGHNLLLRYVNAGLKHHFMTLAGLHAGIIAVDGKPTTFPRSVVAETIAAGQAMDMLVSIPGTAPATAKYPVFDAAMHVDNNGVLTTPGNPNPAFTPIAFGGMLTFIDMGGSVTNGTAPVTNHVALSPNPTSGPAGAVPGPVTLQATITPSTGTTVTAAEYFVDVTGANGAGCAISGSLTNVNVAIPNSGATAPCADLTSLASGNHTFYVHGKDSTATWGAVASAVLNLDKAGPVTGSITVTPNRTNGTAAVALGLTEDDTSTGGQNVDRAEFFIDSDPGLGLASPLSQAVPTPPQLAVTAHYTGTIPASALNSLAEGAHTLMMRGHDVLGNWGASTTSSLVVDKHGPATSLVTATPNPTNGTFGVQGGTGGAFYERIDATVSDAAFGGVSSNIVAAEYFIDTIGANGSGHAMFATDGLFSGTTENVYQLADLYGIAALSEGNHTIYVHGLDAAGNWGAMGTYTLVVDKTGPAISGASLSPNPNAGAATVNLSFTATDALSTVTAAEWWLGADPGKGLGTAISVATPAASVSFVVPINVANFPMGAYTVSFRAYDAAHNWGPTTTLTLNINQRANAIFSDGFESGNFSAWSATGGTPADMAVNGAAKQSGSFGMAAAVSGGASGYVQDNSPAVDATYHARFYFNPNNYTSTTNGTARTIFTGLTGSGGNVFTVQVRRQSNGTYQVSATVNGSGGTTSTAWVTISAAAFTRIEVAWASGSSASFSLYVGSSTTPTFTLTGLNTSAIKLETVRLGPQGVLTGVGGTMYFDNFVSTRNTVIGN